MDPEEKKYLLSLSLSISIGHGEICKLQSALVPHLGVVTCQAATLAR